ncbi:MAG TPA: alpha/beta hydrolase [Candidatus Baltobacteraceae bacterium]|nr:alpha/beta hydrolase [Candidatus Baltobacteraceae bacterium]
MTIRARVTNCESRAPRSAPECAYGSRRYGRAGFLCAAAASVAAAACAIRRPARAAAGRAIAESGFVRIGGIDQWISIRGDDVSNPAIVFLHGGPAEAQSPFLAEFAPWERRYTVVNWDQRGAGRTFERNGTATPDVSVPRMTRDAIEVAEHARRRLGKRNVLLVGQSFGCVLGMRAALERPDVFSAYVGTGQPVSWKLSLDERERYARRRMQAAHDVAALKALDAAQSLPPSDARRLAATNRWRWPASDRAYLQRERDFMNRPDARTDPFVVAWTNAGAFSGPKLWPAISAFDARAQSRDFAIPVFVIDGRDDHITSLPAAKAWLASLRAPAKRFVAIDGGHFACYTDPTQFLAALDRYVRPFAAG